MDTSPDTNALSMQTLRKFRLIFGSVRQHFRDVESRCGISGSQMWLLKEIATTPQIGVSELAARLAIHQSTCSQLVEKLVTKALIGKERSSSDQRRVGLVITTAGRQLLEQAPGPAEGILHEALNALPPESLAHLDQNLADVIAQLSVYNDKLADKPLADL